MHRFDWRRLPPQILLAIVITLIVVPVVAWDQLRGDSPSGDTEVASESADVADGAGGDEIPPAPSTTVLAIQPGWVPKGSSRYGDNGSGGDAIPIITTPVPRNVPGATTTVPPRVKDPKSSTTTTSTRPRPTPTAPAPVDTTPPPTVTSPPPPPPTEPPPVVTTPPPTAPPTTTGAPSGPTGAPGAASSGGVTP